MEMRTSVIVTMALIFVFIAVSATTASAIPCNCGDICVSETGWWHEGGAFNANSTAIQAAVDNANPGETICIKDGTYSENVIVNVNNLKICSENGSANCIVQAAKSRDYVIEVDNADSVTISGLTVTGAGHCAGHWNAGIYLNATVNCDITNNNASYNSYSKGISVWYSNYTTIANNTVANNTIHGYGINLQYSNNNTVRNNTAYWNDALGIMISKSHNNTVVDNTAYTNLEDGIQLSCSNNNTATNNTAYSNGRYGINVYKTSNSTVTNNTVYSNSLAGIQVYSSANNNNITNNMVYLNPINGFYVHKNSDNNTISSNTVQNNGVGINLTSASDNLIYNNYFDNQINAWDNGNNIWNTIKTAGPNIVNGPYLGGNYWSDYNGIDTDKDDIGNTLLPYNSSGSITNGGDWLPLLKVPVHNRDTGENFSRIQQAIDAGNTTEGDLIEVDPGTYRENVKVTKRLTIRSSSGKRTDTIVTALNSSDHVFDVTADYVHLQGFTIENATGSSSAGIYLADSTTHCTITFTIFTNNNYGICVYKSNDNTITYTSATNNNYSIYMSDSDNNTISSNAAYSNHKCGIFISSSDNSTLIYNTANSNNHSGIILSNVNDSFIFHNTAGGNTYSGISLYDLHNNTISTNTASMNKEDGIKLGSSSKNIIEGNTAYMNTWDGFYLYYSNNSVISNNIIQSNQRNGFYLVYSDKNTIANNTVEDNDRGILLSSSNDTLIYNNIFNNTQNAQDDGNNQWNITKTAGPNIIGGAYLGGNYWSDYAGNDTGKDGIGNTLVPYNTGITTGGDWLPLTSTKVETSTGTGIATFSTSSGEFADINGVGENSLPQEAGDNKPTGLTLPHGLFNFTITGLPPGQSVTLTITLPDNVPVGSLWWKVNTTVGNNIWYSLPIGDDDGDNVVTITVTDGGLGDTDGAANGAIVDPGGPGEPIEAPSPCYIATATYGTPLDSNIDVLRDFRDDVLMTNSVGETFVSTYYGTSPPIADALRANNGLRTVTRLTLITPLVYLSKFVLNGIWVVVILIPGLAAVLLIRRDRMNILKSLLVGMGSILMFIGTIFSLGFVGYAIPFCAVIGAYMLPFVIPLSVVFAMCTLLKMRINVSDSAATTKVKEEVRG